MLAGRYRHHSLEMGYTEETLRELKGSREGNIASGGVGQKVGEHKA